jgi:NhaA family Na+:H+ antiporter
MERTYNMIKEFLRLEAAGGLILLATAALALLLVNSPLDWLYNGLLDTRMTLAIGQLEISKELVLWINDGLMAIFFFTVGLEVKREIAEGELSSWDKAALPVIAAVAGIVFPALTFYLVAKDNPEILGGWAIPTATDIAFALGILSLAGKRAPTSLKIFLLALAIIDDIGAILIIAAFYTSKLSLLSLAVAFAGLACMALLNYFKVTRIAAYILIWAVVWVAVLKSGIHATLAGVAAAFFIPLKGNPGDEVSSPAQHLEHALHPWSVYLILPVFAFANAGVSFESMSLSSLTEPLPLGIIAGLFLGKQVGVMAITWLAVKSGLCRLPARVTWLQFYGVALLTGVGFTMSLFIGSLAFDTPDLINDMRAGVLGGSLLSAVAGFLLLRFATRNLPVADSSDPGR